MATAAAAPAMVRSLVIVLLMIIGVYPGAETVPPVTIETAGAGVDDAEPPAVEVVTKASRIGAPRSIAPVANANVYFY